jgi:DNA-binding MarR family transcriptional regulator
VVIGQDVAAGAVARRRMTSRELAVWRSLLDTTAELRRILGAQLQESGLSPADYQVLLALTEADGRMERRGLIGRRDCATDSRGAEIALTEAGAQAFRRASVPHLRAIKQHFADALTPAQFEALAGILQALQDHLHSGDPS